MAIKSRFSLFTLLMLNSPVNIDFELLSLAFQKYIREKAKMSGSTIVYKKDNLLTEENPATFENRILEKYI